MKRMIIATILILALSSLALSARLIGQDTKPAAKPNFTGTWKLNVEKSDFGPTPAPQSMVDKVDHQESSLKIISTRVDGGTESTANLSLTTDGKEGTNTVHGSEVRSKLKWDGAALLIDSSISVDGNALSLKDKWTLSQDGKTLTILRHYAGPEGEANATYVLERQ
jgi:hypothetical protein